MFRIDQADDDHQPLASLLARFARWSMARAAARAAALIVVAIAVAWLIVQWVSAAEQSGFSIFRAAEPRRLAAPRASVSAWHGNGAAC